MSAELASQILSTVAGAASLAPQDAPGAVQRALFRGLWAARHGRGVPLPVLLDVWALIEPSPNGSGSRRGWNGQRSAATDAYIAWLDRFRDDARHQRTRLGAALDYLPLVLRRWPQGGEDAGSLRWAEAYSHLLGSPGCISLAASVWNEPLAESLILWEKWSSASLDDQALPDSAVVAALFSRGGDRLYEALDLAAARMYLEAADPRDFLDQMIRVQRLLRRRRQYAENQTTALEELDPFFGQVALAVLCLGEYGDFKIVNGSAIRITDHPSRRPPNELSIHLCWDSGTAGLAQEFDSRVFGDSHLPGPSLTAAGKTNGASVLQGFTALLLNDWRRSLGALPVRFFLHRGSADLKGHDLGPSGVTWRTYRGACPSPNKALRNRRIVDDKLVKKLFERPGWVSTTPVEGGRDGRGQPREWWCACLLSCDLRGFGFAKDERAAPTPGDGVWIAERAPLVPWTSHVIVLEPPDGGGRIYRLVGGRGGNGPVELRPLPWRRAVTGENDPSYRALRTGALDVALDVLEARMW